jgi:hypothetical protein
MTVRFVSFTIAAISSTSLRVNTIPVGLHGVFRIRTRVFGPIARRNRRRSGRNPVAAGKEVMTGTPSARRTIAG